MDTAHAISASTTPVVLVSACGLVTLALYNRLGSILARLRAFHQQKIELLVSFPEQHAAELQMLLDMLDLQVVEVTRKAVAIQHGLYCMLAAIAAFLLCSMLAGVAVWYAPAGVIALIIGSLGLCFFLGGIGCAIGELSLSLSPLREETAFLDVLTSHHLANPPAGQRLRVAKSA